MTTPTVLHFIILVHLTSAAGAHGLRLLHHHHRHQQQLFFPPTSSPSSASISLSPTEPPIPSITPKHPSSTVTTKPAPFFPTFPPPPPPPPPPQSPTFPANISSLIFPSSQNSSHHSPSRHLLLSVALPILCFALVLLISLGLFFVYRRSHRRHCFDDSYSDNHRLFPPNPATSDSSKPPSAPSGPNSSEFLYLGTLVNSRGQSNQPCPAPPADVSSPSRYRRLGSPELRPLPPLPRQCRQNHGDVGGGHSPEEEFYSPKGSPGCRGVVSSSHKIYHDAPLEQCGSHSSNTSSRSCPSSNTVSSPSPSSPTASSSIKSMRSRSKKTSFGAIEFRPPPPPLPPRKPLRAPTPSPPKRRPTSPAPVPSSSLDIGLDKSLDFSGQKSNIGEYAKDRFVVEPPRTQPPPPPPPPPGGYWEGQFVNHQACQPPVPVPQKPIGPKNPAALVFPVVSPKNSDSSERIENHPRPKLKPLHWDKVRASSDRAMVWDQLRSSSFQLNEEMIETLFMYNTTSATTKEMAHGSPNQEVRVLDPKKSQNIAILLRALHVTKEDVCKALLEGDPGNLGSELLEALLRMAPSKEEELKLKEYKDDSPYKLGPAEKFLKALLNIPFAFKRIDAMLYIANFDSEVNFLRNSFKTLETACEELRSSRLFLKLLEAVLKTGNRMNVGTNRGDAHAFKLDTLLKLVDIKGTDGKTTLLHFVVQEIVKAEGVRLSKPRTQVNALQDDQEFKILGLQVVSGLSGDLNNVKKVAAMDCFVLSSYVTKLAGGVQKLREVLRLNDSQNSPQSARQFQDTMTVFLKRAEEEIIKVQAQETVALSLVKEITDYFHGDSAKKEAHPFRIFMVVRDFLSVLDQVCKEVGMINKKFTVGLRQFPVAMNRNLQPGFTESHSSMSAGSSDDDTSPSLSP